MILLQLLLLLPQLQACCCRSADDADDADQSKVAAVGDQMLSWLLFALLQEHGLLLSKGVDECCHNSYIYLLHKFLLPP